jgi:hypothetical protein
VTQRYVIDYYYDDGEDGDYVPPMGAAADPGATRSIVVDVRPAADSLAAVYHRLRRFPGRLYESYQVRSLNRATLPA